MIETQCQQLIITAVKEIGGRGLKLSNRFLVGVCDLLVQMPGYPAFILEAKLHNLSAKSLGKGHLIEDVGCTKLQRDFLRDWHDAGMLTGVASFIQVPGRETIGSLRLALYSYEQMLAGHWAVHSHNHSALGEKSERMLNIRALLAEFVNNG